MAEAALRVGCEPSSLKLVAVTKTVSAERMLEAISAGADLIGENRVQEAMEKAPAIRQALESSHSETPAPHWHLIGHLQRNKVRHVFGLFEAIHSVDSLRLIEALETRAAHGDGHMRVFLEASVAGEEGKHGCRLEEVQGLATAVERSPHLKLEGLMTMAPFARDPEDSRPWFRKLRELRDGLVNEGHAGLRELSMGMTADFEVAIEEGATVVRVGSAIFGPRN